MAETAKGKQGYFNYPWPCGNVLICPELLILGLTGLDNWLCRSDSRLDPNNTTS